MVTRFLPSIAAAIVLLAMSLATDLHPIPRGLGVACVVASFALAAFMQRREVRTHGAVVAGIFAVVAAGQVAGGMLFGILATSFIMASLFALREARRKEMVAVQVKPIAITLGFTALIVTLSVIFLPPIAARIERTVTSMMGVDGEEGTAFSTTMALGSTTGMLQSNAIVARIDGIEPDYLRGAVYDRYDGHFWINVNGRELHVVKATEAARFMSTIVLDRHAPAGGLDMRWFLPPSACGFIVDVQVDAFGVVRRGAGPTPAKLDYDRGKCEMPLPLKPTQQDLEVPSHIRRQITELAHEAAGNAATDKDKLEAIQKSLAGFEYSLAVKRNDRLDPVVDFLTEHKAGHCEMFASAMALEARALGIPTRVVGGYHVSELDRSGDHWVVRDRNAHAWLEAWDGHHWQAWDPTPLSDAPEARPGAWRRLLDRASDLWALAWDAVVALGPLGFAMVLSALVVALLVIRQLGLWLRRPRRRRMAAALERPLPCFEKLTLALEAKGFVRDPSEPLETYAARLPQEAASAVGAYAAFRYGNVGVETDVVAIVEAAIAKARSYLPSTATKAKPSVPAS